MDEIFKQYGGVIVTVIAIGVLLLVVRSVAGDQIQAGIQQMLSNLTGAIPTLSTP